MPGWAFVIPDSAVAAVQDADLPVKVGSPEVAFFPELKLFHEKVMSDPNKAMDLIKRAMKDMKP